jgi:tRNA pseudouridine(38-40) synthase
MTCISGNKNYRHLIRQRKDEYTRTTKRSEKNDIAEWLFDKITAEQNGRFLKAVEVNFPGRKTQTKYVVVDKSVAMEKIRQSLRQSLNRPKPSPGANGSENEDGYPKAVSPSNLHPTAATASPTNGNKHRNEPPETQSAPSKKARQEPPRNHLQTPPPPYDLQRYKLVLSYDGTRFSGWQRQSSNSSKDAHSRPPKNIRDMKKRHHDAMGKVISIPVTVQESLEDALEMYSGLDRPSLRMRMAGRTDAGVHANGQTVAVSLPKPGSKGSTVQDVELWQIRRAINSRLPMDISVNDISICDESFDPRHDVISKQYSYTIRYRRKMSNDKGEVLPICEKGGPQVRISNMSLYATFNGEYPFSNFCPCVSRFSSLTAVAHGV